MIAIMDSVRTIREEYGEIIYAFEIFFTFVFAIEYILRVACLLQPRRYILSAMGVVDIASIIPTFVSKSSPIPIPLPSTMYSINQLIVQILYFRSFLTTRTSIS
jgi:voltage-gated potassium channel